MATAGQLTSRLRKSVSSNAVVTAAAPLLTLRTDPDKASQAALATDVAEFVTTGTA